MTRRPLHRCWPLVMAFVLAFLASPSSQEPEGSFGRGPVPAVVGMAGLVVSGVVEHVENDDPVGVQVFTLALGDANGRITIMADRDLPTARYLRSHLGQRVSLELHGRGEQ